MSESAPSRPLGFFVTGTDTGVGKTLASCALLHALRQHLSARLASPRVIGMKAVAAGTERDAQGIWFNSDVRALQEASSMQADPALVCPDVLAAPLSPHLAAELEGKRLSLSRIVQASAQLQQQADALVVEGAGGYAVPLTLEESGADLAKALGLPVVIVVGMRLGCLNHALLTAQAVQASGLPIAGWIANDLSPDMPAHSGNLAYLQHHFSQRFAAPLLGRLPWQADAAHTPHNSLAQRLSACLDVRALIPAP